LPTIQASCAYKEVISWIRARIASRRGACLCATFAVLITLAAVLGAQPPRAPACADRPVFAWLDFWVGEWRVLVDGQQVGTNRIRKVLDGCAVVEEWTDARGGTGQSLFYVSAAGSRCG